MCEYIYNMSTCKNILLLKLHYYRPHPKDGKGTVFTSVCQSTPGAGVPHLLVPGLFPASGSMSFPRAITVPSGGGGVGYTSHSWGVPQDRTSQMGLGYPPAGTGVPFS